MNRNLTLIVFCCISIVIYSFCTPPADNSTEVETTDIQSEKTPEQLNANQVKWYTWEEAIEANKKNPKKLFVDVYTNWCGWCKVMDKKTFTQKEVATYLNKHFYPIKLNAEQKEDITFRGKTFSWKEGGRNGVHALAYSILKGKLSYPTIVYLDSKYDIIATSPGYKTPKTIMPELTYAADELYRKTKWEDYMEKVRVDLESESKN